MKRKGFHNEQQIATAFTEKNKLVVIRQNSRSLHAIRRKIELFALLVCKLNKTKPFLGGTTNYKWVKPFYKS